MTQGFAGEKSIELDRIQFKIKESFYMKALLKRLSFAMAMLFATSVSAVDYKFSAGGGFNLNFPKVDEDLGDGIDEAVSANLTIAGRTEFVFNEKWSLRTGANIQEKSAKFELDAGSFEGTLEMNLISVGIPLYGQYRVSEDIAFFAGYNADFIINDYCTGDGDVDGCYIIANKKSPVHNLAVGALIKGSDKFDVEINYQHGLSEVYKNIKIHTLQAMALYKF